MSWTDGAACKGHGLSLFFPEVGEPAAAAKAICGGCPVRERCLEENLGERIGVWGGTSQQDRVALRRARRLGGEVWRRVSCRVCGTTFSADSPGVVFCSDECRRRARGLSRRNYLDRTA